MRCNINLNSNDLSGAAGAEKPPEKVFPLGSEQLSADALFLHLNAIIESSDDAILSKDLNGVIRSWNKGAERIFGYTAPEIIGKSVTILIPHERENEEPEILSRIRRGERIDHYETVRQRKDGSKVNISLAVSPIKDRDGKVIGASKIVRDITDRKTSDELQRNFSAIVESSDDAILSKDLNGTIQSWNNGAERMFGYLPVEVIGKPGTLLMPVDRENEEPEILSRIRVGERVDHYETIRQRKDGSLIHISLSVSPIKNSAGVVIGASKIARDITERKQAETEIQKAREELAQANALLEQRVEERTASLNKAVAQMHEFSYTVSHDLRGPVRAMHGYAKVILEDYAKNLDPKAVEFLNRIVRGSSRMDKLIHDVLIYSRLAQTDIECKPVSLDGLVREIIIQYPEMQPPHVDVQILSPLLSVLGDESLLTQALSNLLSNAKKFVAPGVSPKIEIVSERRADRMRLWIKDNGIGIKPEHQSRLFGMFERVGQSVKYEGTGIGLAIVRKAVEKMGGTAGVESDGVNGSLFWIELRPAD